MNKQTLLIAGIIIIIIGLGVWVGTSYRGTTNEEVVEEVGVEENNGTTNGGSGAVGANTQVVCFENKTTSIIATLKNDNTVAGQLDYTPAQEDSLVGPFGGTWKASGTTRTLDVVQTYTAEGVTANEPRRIVFNGSYATIDWDGLGALEASSEQVPKVACGVN